MRPMRILRPLLAAAALAFAGQAQAVLNIEITQGAPGARPIAIVPFGNASGVHSPVDIARLVSGDLKLSGQFAPMKRRNMVATPTSADQLRFSNWRTADVDNVVIGQVRAADNGGYVVRFQLFDVIHQRQIAGYSFHAPANALRGLAHEISDVIYKKITGERGAFNTRIAFVDSKGKKDQRQYRLLVADYDGYNARPILTSGQPIMSPAWSPDGKRIAYVSFEHGRPAVYVQQVATGKRKRVSQRKGINGAPAWSPDGKRLAMALSYQGGDPDLYVLNLSNNQLHRVTRSGGIDTSPSWTPDGKSLIFTSDRAGSPQLYRIAADGSGTAKRLTFEGNYNAAPDVSPNGKKVAFVHRNGQNQYRIAIYDLDTGFMQVLSDGSLDESPTFAPNGRMILYATEHNDRGVLGAVSADGSVAVRLSQAQGNIREPAWGPFRE